MLFDKLLHAIDILAPESVASFQPNRIESELGFAIVAFDVHVRRLVPVARIKEEPKWPDPQHRRHPGMLPRTPGSDN